MADITDETVRHVALLSRLDLTEDEVQHFTEDLKNIVGYVEKLAALDVSDVPPMSHSMKLENVFREDELRPSLTNEEALANAPASEEGCFKVSAVLQDAS